MTTDLVDLVTAAKGGDKAAFEELVRLTYTDTYTLARRLTGNEEDARDVVQETYLRAFKSIKSFRGDARFSTWLYRVTSNCASTHMGKRSRARHEELDNQEGLVDERVEADPDAMAGSSLERDRINAALDSLPDTLRSVVVLRDIYDLTHDDIALQLGISEPTAKVRLHRAHKKLRERLFPMSGEESAHAV